MTVVLKPANERVSKSAIGEAWGLLSDAITSRDDVGKAIALVLGYEQDLIDDRAIRGVPSDIAHSEACYRDGKREGLEIAARALLDAKHIANRRGRLEEQQKETES